MKKNAIPKDQKPQDPAAYYQLHTEAVDDLISASKENAPKYSQEELEKYRGRKLRFHIPDPLKALLIKFWFYGAICFFVFMGLGVYLSSSLDMFFVAAIIIGLVTDLLINHFLRFTEKLPGGNAKWMMITRRGVWGMIMNIAYGFLLLYLVMMAYSLINMLFATGSKEQSGILGVEPIGFGLIATGIDLLLISIKRLMMKIISDAKASLK